MYIIYDSVTGKVKYTVNARNTSFLKLKPEENFIESQDSIDNPDDYYVQSGSLVKTDTRKEVRIINSETRKRIQAAYQASSREDEVYKRLREDHPGWTYMERNRILAKRSELISGLTTSTTADYTSDSMWGTSYNHNNYFGFIGTSDLPASVTATNSGPFVIDQYNSQVKINDYLTYITSSEVTNMSTMKKFSRGSITPSSSLSDLNTQCVSANEDTSYRRLDFITTDFSPPDEDDYIIRIRYFMKTDRRMTNIRMTTSASGVNEGVSMFLVRTDSTGSTFTPANEIDNLKIGYTTSGISTSSNVNQSDWGTAHSDGYYYFWFDFYFIEASGPQSSTGISIGYTLEDTGSGQTVVAPSAIQGDHEMIDATRITSQTVVDDINSNYSSITASLDNGAVKIASDFAGPGSILDINDPYYGLWTTLGIAVQQYAGSRTVGTLDMSTDVHITRFLLTKGTWTVEHIPDTGKYCLFFLIHPDSEPISGINDGNFDITDIFNMQTYTHDSVDYRYYIMDTRHAVGADYNGTILEITI